MQKPVRVSDIEPQPIRWAWGERFPVGMISVVAGRPAAAKGLLSYRIAADITQAGGRVLISSIEEGFGSMSRPRLEVAGADMDRVLMWQCLLPAHMRQLAHLLREPPGFDVLVLDPFAAHLSDGIKRHSDEVREMLTPFKALLEETDTAGLIVEHVIKKVPSGSDPMYGIGGNSSGLIAACRMAFLFGADPENEDRRLLACVKPGVREMPPALEFDLDAIEHPVGTQPVLVPKGECDFDARKLLFEPGKKGRPAAQRAAAAEWLANYLYDTGHPVPAALVLEDAKQFGLKEKTLRRAAIDDVKVIKHPPGGGPKVKWSLPDKLRDAIKQTRDAGSLISDEELDALLGP